MAFCVCIVRIIIRYRKRAFTASDYAIAVAIAANAFSAIFRQSSLTRSLAPGRTQSEADRVTGGATWLPPAFLAPRRH